MVTDDISERLDAARAHRLAVLAGATPSAAAPVANVATPAAVKLRHLRRALQRWQAAGRPLAPRAVRQARGAACRACPHWHPGGNLGLGECAAPGCGCTRAKWWLATEACPLGKWAPSAVTR